MPFLKSVLLVFCLCLSTGIFAQTPPLTPSNPSPQNPIPTPVPPLPPATNPSARPSDTTSIKISPSPNQPQPATITPTEPFPKSQEDTVFRNNKDTPSPFRIDSVPTPKK